MLVVDQELRPDLGARALALGADGFLPLGVDVEELLAAVRSASTGSARRVTTATIPWSAPATSRRASTAWATTSA